MTTIRDITMYNDVGFDMTHKHCLDFPDAASRDGYFDGLRDRTVFANANYNKVDNTLNLECDWEDGLSFSYCSLTYKNKRMFFFVTGCRVVNEKVTGFELQMDVWQTFLFDFTVGEGMVTREHVDRWDRDGKVLWRRGVNEDKICVYDSNRSIELNQTLIGSMPQYNVNLYLGGLFITHLKTNIENERTHSFYETIFIPVIHIKPIDPTQAISGNGYINSIKWWHTEEGHLVERKLLTPSRLLYGDVFGWLNIDPKSVIGISYQPNVVMNIYGHVELSYYPSIDVVFHSEELGSPFVDYLNRVDVEVSDYTYFTDFNDFATIFDQPDYSPKLESRIYNTNTTITRPVKPIDNDTYSATHEPELFKNPYIIRSLSDDNGSIIGEIPDICWFDDYGLYVTKPLKENQSVDVIYLFDSLNKDYIKPKDYASLSNRGLTFKIGGSQLDVPSDEWKSYVISAKDTDRQMLQSTINQHGVTSTLSAIIGMGGISGMAGSGKGSGLGFNPAQAGAGAGIGAVMGVGGWIANQYFGWEQQDIKERGVRNQPNNLLRSATGDGFIKWLYGNHTYNELKCNDSAFNQAARRYHKYGYKVDMMAVPNIRTRKYFNFVQTSQIRIEGAMVQAVRDGIADIFNNGVTIWHGENITKESGSNKFVLDYSKENIERSLL